MYRSTYNLFLNIEVRERSLIILGGAGGMRGDELSVQAN
jgi:hypothetical protein